MLEIRLKTVLKKALKTNDSDIKEQLLTLKDITYDLKDLDPLFNQWYINNVDVDNSMNEEELEEISAPLEYKFPSNKAEIYLFQERKTAPTDVSLLWNGGNKETFASIALGIMGFNLAIQKKIGVDIFVKVFEIILKKFSLDYIYLTTEFIHNTLIFKHRHTVSPICYVPQIISENSIPHLYKKIDVLNDLNQGSILIFDENIFEESDRMKKIIEENAIALVALDAIPETELDSDFFSEVDL
ncbi:hypothetical protein [Acinetobacter bereziniae]|uniref:hypothetical protein n=1 Tax=Acinetobacter bereziniae TaxID=106648 RepID=UPI00300983A6